MNVRPVRSPSLWRLRVVQWMHVSAVFVLIAAASSLSRAQVSVTADTIRFQGIKIGFSRDAITSIRNVGTTTAHVTEVKVYPLFATPGEFQVITGGNAPYDLAPSQPAQILLRFTPQQPGLRTAYVRIIADGDTSVIQLVAFGLTIEPDLIIIPSSIDFGIRLPNAVADTVVTVVAVGPDSATVYTYTVANNNAIICYEAMPEDPAVNLPLVMHVHDSLKMHIRFTPTLPAGRYTGQLVMQGEVTGAPTCDFTADVEVPNVTVEPSLIDFGDLPQGASYDSILYVINTSHFDAHLEAFTPLAAPFSYVNLPAVPYLLSAGDTLALRVHLDGTNAGAFTASIDVTEHSPPLPASERLSFLQAIIRPIVLQSSGASVIHALCGIDSDYSGAIMLTDTGAYSAIIDAIRADNNDLTFSPGQLPDTVQTMGTVTFAFNYHATAALLHDTTIGITIYWKGKPVLRDSVLIVVTSVVSPVALTAVPTPNTRTVVVSPRLDPYVAKYDLSSLSFDLSIAPADLAELDLTSLRSVLGTNATITPVLIGPGQYRITLQSTSGPITTSFDSLLSFSLDFFVTSDSLARVTVQTISPEKAGCLDFDPITVMASSPSLCGDEEMRSFLQTYGSQVTVRIVNNPLSGSTLEVAFAVPSASSLDASVLSLTGAVLLDGGTRSVPSGRSNLQFDVSSLQSGSYLLELRVKMQNMGATVLTRPFTILR